MKKTGFVVGVGLIIVGSVAASFAHKVDLPAGPIRDRHELMEGIGKNAKTIGDGMKSGNFAPVGPAAEKIQADAAKVDALFPPGSTDPKSRAKPEIWANWPKFQAGTKELATTAGALAAAAQAGSGVPQAAQKMFDSCKGCHEQFRVPEKKK